MLVASALSEASAEGASPPSAESLELHSEAPATSRMPFVNSELVEDEEPRVDSPTHTGFPTRARLGSFSKDTASLSSLPRQVETAPQSIKLPKAKKPRRDKPNKTEASESRGFSTQSMKTAPKLSKAKAKKRAKMPSPLKIDLPELPRKGIALKSVCGEAAVDDCEVSTLKGVRLVLGLAEDGRRLAAHLPVGPALSDSGLPLDSAFVARCSEASLGGLAEDAWSLSSPSWSPLGLPKGLAFPSPRGVVRVKEFSLPAANHAFQKRLVVLEPSQTEALEDGKGPAKASTVALVSYYWVARPRPLGRAELAKPPLRLCASLKRRAAEAEAEGGDQKEALCRALGPLAPPGLSKALAL